MVTKMSDLIDRDDAIMAVKAGALSAATLFGRSDAGMTALRDTVRAINSLPSAQPDDEEANYWHEKANSYEQTLVRLSQSIAEQPEIIRCKDCKWWAKQKDSLQGRCELMKMYPTGGWFCANARKERR